MPGKTIEPGKGGISGVPDMLLVTSDARAAAARATAPVEASPLLARMEAFLPQLAAANAALDPDAGPQSCVEIVGRKARETGALKPSDDAAEEDADEADEEGEGGMRFDVAESSESENEAEAGAVVMNLFVDKSMGELVAQEDTGAVKPLIEEVDGGEGK